MRPVDSICCYLLQQMVHTKLFISRQKPDIEFHNIHGTAGQQRFSDRNHQYLQILPIGQPRSSDSEDA